MTSRYGAHLRNGSKTGTLVVVHKSVLQISPDENVGQHSHNVLT